MTVSAPHGDSAADLYPASPRDLPEMRLMTNAYRIRVGLVLISLFVFLALYFGLVGSSIWLFVSAAEAAGEGAGFWPFPTLVVAALLIAFFVKGLFKRHPLDTDHWLEITPREQPRLFAFLRRLCADAGARLPRRVYLTCEVQAMVAYPRSLLSLLWPVRKDLIIGLGLVNALNLSEFKGVLAHEFGHFSQSTMKLGQYVYVANKVMLDLVYGRDAFDRMLYAGARQDGFFAVFAWLLIGLVWMLRKVLAALFWITNLLNFSLSRQMEFNADLHAVRLCGSDALVSALWKLERASLALQLASEDLASRADHKRFTDDVYAHQADSLERLPGLLESSGIDRAEYAYLVDPYRPGETIHFPDAPAQHATMWETHPPMREREQNAKRRFVSGVQDARSAWELFDGQSALRRRLTREAYRLWGGLELGPGALSPAAVVQAEIREERAELEQAPHYHGLYDDRIVDPGDIVGLVRELDAQGESFEAALRERLEAVTGAPLRELMQQRKSLQDEAQLLDSLASGSLEPRAADPELRFRGQALASVDVESAQARVHRERDALEQQLARIDRDVFCYFYRRSGRDPEVRHELAQRYLFLVGVQRAVRRLNPVEMQVGAVFELLGQASDLDEDDIEAVVETFREAHRELAAALAEVEDLRLPALSHLDAGATVRSFVLPRDDGELVELFELLTGDWLAAFAEQFHQVLSRLRKLHFKNLGVLLRLQEKLDPALFGAPRVPSPRTESSL